MRRRTFLLRSAGLAASWCPATRFAPAQTWSPKVLEFVRGRQEQEYNHLADLLGLGTAKNSYNKIANRPMPSDLKQEYGSAPLPTPFEDPYMYPIMTKTFEGLSQENNALSRPALPHPFLATLPSGDVNAGTEEVHETKTPVVFFEQGLFSFFYDMAKLMAWAAPPLTDRQLTDDAALAAIGNSYTIPPQGAEYFAATLSAYALSGSPVAESTPIPEPRLNIGLSKSLLNHMVRFVMLHELAHVQAQDYENPRQTPEREYNADEAAVSLVTTLAGKYHGSWALGYWGCDLALVALNFLYRSVALLTYGGKKLNWVSPTHPDPLSRRAKLRGMWRNPFSPEAGVAAAGMVTRMTEKLLQILWEDTDWILLLRYQQGLRASPRWRKTAKSFAARDA